VLFAFSELVRCGACPGGSWLRVNRNRPGGKRLPAVLRNGWETRSAMCRRWGRSVLDLSILKNDRLLSASGTASWGRLTLRN
jgi:hypothetical protein